MVDLAPCSLRACLAVAALVSAGWFAAHAPVAAQPGGGGGAAASEPNVYAGGGQVRPAAEVKGDFTAAGGRVIVDRAVAGDATLAGGSVDVRAPVGDDVRAGGGDVSIESMVGGELFVTGGNITLTRTAAIARGATLYGGSVTIDGRIDGELRVTASKVTIDGEVRGDTHLVAEEIELGPRARIGGGLSYVSPSELKQAEGATIAGALTRQQATPQARGGPGASRERDAGRRWEDAASGASWGGGLLLFLALLATGALFLLLLPRLGASASLRIRSSPFAALGVGFATVVATPVLAVLLFITLLGIPLGIALLALYPVFLLAGFLAGVLFIGQLLAAAFRKEAPRGFAAGFGYFALALSLTLLVAWVPLVGGLLVVLLSLAGVGACVLELHARRNGRADGPPAAAPNLPPVPGAASTPSNPPPGIVS